MRVRRHPSNIRRMLASRLKQVAVAKPILIATLAEVGKVCGKPSCRCRRGFKHRACQLTFQDQGKTRALYVPVDFTEEVRSWIAEYHKLQRLLREISDLSLMLVRSHAQERKRRQGRS
jgi:hypothetical protein